ncbi:DUF952 domain-containing protein [Sphingorhabdus pulchriflava]
MITPHPATERWAQFQAEGMFHGAPVDLADGYIHLSPTPITG